MRIYSHDGKKMTEQESLKTTICRYLVRHTTLSLATCHNSQPWSTDLFYASDDSCRLYFVSSVTTRHCRHIAVNPHVSASISGQCDDWKEIKGVQLDGMAEALPDPDRHWVTEMYLTKFPSLRTMHKASEILSAFWESSFYRISPRWIRLIDNSKGFGHKDEMIFQQEITTELGNKRNGEFTEGVLFLLKEHNMQVHHS